MVYNSSGHLMWSLFATRCIGTDAHRTAHPLVATSYLLLCLCGLMGARIGQGEDLMGDMVCRN